MSKPNAAYVTTINQLLATFENGQDISRDDVDISDLVHRACTLRIVPVLNATCGGDIIVAFQFLNTSVRAYLVRDDRAGQAWEAANAGAYPNGKPPRPPAILRLVASM